MKGIIDNFFMALLTALYDKRIKNTICEIKISHFQ